MKDNSSVGHTYVAAAVSLSSPESSSSASSTSLTALSGIVRRVLSPRRCRAVDSVPAKPGRTGLPTRLATRSSSSSLLTTWQDEGSQDDLDYDLGDLVIDLDVDLEKGNNSESPPQSGGSDKPAAAAADLSTLDSSDNRSINAGACGGAVDTATSAINALGRMNTIEHQATVDKGLKMKIKRKNVAAGSKASGVVAAAASVAAAPAESKHDIIKGGCMDHSGKTNNATNGSGVSCTTDTVGAGSMPSSLSQSPLAKLKQVVAEKDREKDKSNKGGAGGRGAYKRATAARDKGGRGNCLGDPLQGAALHSGGNNPLGAPSNAASMVGSSVAMNSLAGPLANIGSANNTMATVGTSSSASLAGNVTVELDRISTPLNIKKEPPCPDPYEFNAKLEDHIRQLPMKKIKIEKTETSSSPISMQQPIYSMPGEHKDACVETSSVGVVTDPDCLGACEPGTSVVLEGIVWNETESAGILVVNVTWRGKTYVGTLMDATQHDWAPPRFSCDSPASEEMNRTPRGRGKRGRVAAATPLNEAPPGERRLRRRKGNNNPFAAPPSPSRAEAAASGAKRRGRPIDLELDEECLKNMKRARISTSRNDTSSSSAAAHVEVSASGFIECPEPNCSKRYRHINGLRYHQTHSHCRKSTSSSPVAKVEKMDVDNGDSNSKDNTPAAELASPAKRGKTRGGSSSSNNSSIQEDSMDSCSQVKNGSTQEQPAEPKGRKGSSSSAVSDGKKSDKSSVKQDKIDKQATVALTHLNVDKVKGSVGAGTPAVTSSSVLSSTTVGLTAATGFPSPGKAGLAVALTATPAQADLCSKKAKGVIADKPKGKVTLTRPIVPAPVPVAAATSTLSSVTTHAQISLAGTSSQLKPIQPKPTIMGEPINPALASLKEMKESKKSKKKKNKDKDKEKEKEKEKEKDKSNKKSTQLSETVSQAGTGAATTANSGAKLQQEQLSVIKPVGNILPKAQDLAKQPVGASSTTAPPQLQKQPVTSGSTPSELDKSTRSPPELQKQVYPGSSIITSAKVDSPIKAQVDQSGRPPSHLSLNSPLRAASESKESSGEVQSPAYSDISDANDSAPSLEGDLEPVPKLKDQDKADGASMKLGQSAASTTSGQPKPSPVGSQYGNNMYPRMYGQGQYMSSPMQAGGSRDSPLQHQQGPPHHHQSHIQDNKGAGAILGVAAGGHGASAAGGAPKDKLKAVSDSSKQTNMSPNSMHTINTQNRNNGAGKSGGGGGGPPGGATAEQIKEYQERVLQAQQMYGAHYQQYMNAAYRGYSMDPAYHMHLMNSNPDYKLQYEKWMQDQERRQREYMEQQQKHASMVAAGSRGEPNSPLDLNTKAIDLSKQGKPSPVSRPPSASREGKEAAGASTTKEDLSSKPGREQGKEVGVIKDKQTENHQIMKENIELKTQMDRQNYDAKYNQMYTRHNDDLRRYYMYQQQQRSMEQQRYAGQAGGAVPGGAARPTPKGAMPPKETMGDRARINGTPTSASDAGGGTKGSEQSTPNKSLGGFPHEHPTPKGERSRDASPAVAKDRSQGMTASATPSASPAGTPKPSKESPAGPPPPAVGSSPGNIPMSYGQYYPQQQYGGAPYNEASHPMYQQQQGVNPLVGYAAGGAHYQGYPAHVQYAMGANNPGSGSKPSPESTPHPKDRSRASTPVMGSPGGMPPEGKALDMLQQRAASYYNNSPQQHKVQELKDSPKPPPQKEAPPTLTNLTPMKSPAGKEVDGHPDPDSQVLALGELGGKSPPTQRHVHTHHHTHVVGSAYSLYGPAYSGKSDSFR